MLVDLCDLRFGRDHVNEIYLLSYLLFGWHLMEADQLDQTNLLK
jgi:hypothetical protein